MSPIKFSSKRLLTSFFLDFDDGLDSKVEKKEFAMVRGQHMMAVPEADAWAEYRTGEVPEEWAVEETVPRNQWAEVMPGQGGADIVDIKAWEAIMKRGLEEAAEEHEEFNREKAASYKRAVEGHEAERARAREMGTAQFLYMQEEGERSGLLSPLGTPANSLASLPDLVEDSSSEGSSLWSTSGELEWIAIE